jgi:hypothetical protein
MVSPFNPMSLRYIAPETVDPKPGATSTESLPPLSQALPALVLSSTGASKPNLPSFAELNLSAEFHHPRELAVRLAYGSNGSSYSVTSADFSHGHRVSPVFHRGHKTIGYDPSSVSSTYLHGPPSPPSSTSVPSLYADSSRSVSPASLNDHLNKLPSREDRNEYDLEERFAMVYLRAQSDPALCRWKDLVEKAWPHLFPPGQPRRTTAPLPPGKSLPSTYDTRTAGALQCRYYRIRDTAGMGTVRGGRKGNPNAARDGMTRLEIELAQHWFKKMDPVDISCLGLGRRLDEDDVAWMKRVRTGYRQYSHFWQLLRSLSIRPLQEFA